MQSDLGAFSDWLAATPASLFIQTQTWLIPTVQTVHILAIAVVLSSVGMVNLRVQGWAGLRASISETARRYVPWVWGGLAVLLTTGVVLVVGEPERAVQNRMFQSKLVLIVALVGLTLAFQRAVARKAPLWDHEPRLSARVRAAALATFALCLVIAVLGRWIAYWVTE